MPYNTEKMRHACKSKHKLTRENQVIIPMIADGKKWYYLAVKNYLLCFAKQHQSIMETFYV